MALIEADQLTKRFGERPAVEGLSFEVQEGEALGLLGPNGAGKTTTIRMLAGIISPTSGHAQIAGIRMDREVERLHEVIGLLPEAPGFYERLSARRNLEFFAGFYSNIAVGAQVEKYLRLMGLWERRDERVATFSKGLKQRLALARALLHEPKVLFFDEPTAGLDPEAAAEVRELIERLKAEGRTILLSTHNLVEAEALCDRIAVVRTRLLALEAPEGLRRRFFQRRVVVRLDGMASGVLAAVRGLASVRGLTSDGSRLVVELEEPERDRPELVAAIVKSGGRVLEVTEESHSLEEVYLALVREEGEHVE
jgi:ABC-2 type transport system ATP-binding protein